MILSELVTGEHLLLYGRSSRIFPMPCLAFLRFVKLVL